MATSIITQPSQAIASKINSLVALLDMGWPARQVTMTRFILVELQTHGVWTCVFQICRATGDVYRNKGFMNRGDCLGEIDTLLAGLRRKR